jgi:glycosyltransferase involved in cell wall biosynthesis|tara:strand:- start:11980 stop:13179 length:1200 start_codon:yes stop_codon:yes gene_type:complete
MNKLKILIAPANQGGCSYYRAWAPFAKLAEKFPDLIEIKFNENPLGLNIENGQWIEDWDFADMKWADIVMTQNIHNYGGPYTARIVGKAKEFGKFVHFDTDDLLTELYEGHRLKSVYEDRGLSELTKYLYANADLVTVTQRKFAERIKDYCSGVLAVAKNAIDYNLENWNHPKVPVRRKRLVRVGWAGGIHHEEDVKEFAGIPHLVNQRVGRENVEWHFFGKPPKDPNNSKEDWQLDVWDNYERTLTQGFRGAKNWYIHGALPSDQYGVIFANIDIAIAPLQMNAFNDSKSEIKVAECGRYKVPLIASNVGCYDETIINGKTGYLLDPKASKTDWVKVLTKVIKDKKHREQMGNNLFDITQEYFDLNKVIGQRLKLYKDTFTMLKRDDLLKKIEGFELV